MVKSSGDEVPEFSVVIPIRDRWEELKDCLDALARQQAPPRFEAVIVDDGSSLEAPEYLGNGTLPFELRIKKQKPMGIAAARNTGVAEARGGTIVFVDSDCVPDQHFMAAVKAMTDRWDQEIGFQAYVRGHSKSMVGRLEALRLESVQEIKQTPDGHVTFLNTSGFVIRSSFFADRPAPFDVESKRGEDTMLLADLLAAGKPPRFMSEAIVEHHPRLSLSRYLWKHLRIGYETRKGRDRLKLVGEGLLASGDRLRMMSSMWRRAQWERRGSVTFGLAMLAFAIELVGRTASRFSGGRGHLEYE